MSTRTVHVGDVLYFVRTSGYRKNEEGKEVTVTKVGRKWFHFDGGYYKAAIQNWMVDGGQYGSPGRIYENAAAYEEEERRAEAWHELRKGIDRFYTPPGHLTTDQIVEVLKIIKEPPTEAGKV